MDLSFRGLPLTRDKILNNSQMEPIPPSPYFLGCQPPPSSLLEQGRPSAFHPSMPRAQKPEFVCAHAASPHLSLAPGANALRGWDVAGPAGGGRHHVALLEQRARRLPPVPSLLVALGGHLLSSRCPPATPPTYIGSAATSTKWGVLVPTFQTSGTRFRGHTTFHPHLTPKPHALSTSQSQTRGGGKLGGRTWAADLPPGFLVCKGKGVHVSRPTPTPTPWPLAVL